MSHWYIYVIILLVIFAAYGIFLAFKKGKQKGADDLLKLFLVNGYDLKVAGFKEQNKSVLKNGIVFVGDSITQDYPLQDFYPWCVVYNRGIGGDTSVGLLKRLNESVFDLEPSKVVLLIGTNDFGVLNAKVSEVAKRINQIVETIHLHLPNTKIILESVYPVNISLSDSIRYRSNEDIIELNKLLAFTKNVTFVDIASLLMDEDGNLNPQYTVEGLHINAQGYRVISSALAPYIVKNERM
jgi:lysophospholipase L1-like esterase